MKLYELPQKYEEILSKLTDGEVTPDLEAELGALDETLQTKTEGICKMVQALNREAESANLEVARLSALAEIRLNAAARLKDYLKLTLELMNMTKVETDLFKVRIQKNSRPGIAYIGDLRELPFEYQRVKVELNGTALYEAWKGGKELPAGVTVTEGSHIRIS
jgi:hypothetical protein